MTPEDRVRLGHMLEAIGDAQAFIAGRDRADIPWPAIVSMRHRLVHAYARVKLDIVWKTVLQDLPPLKTAIEAALA